MKYILTLTFLFLPSLIYAQGRAGNTVQELLLAFIAFANNVLVPFIFAIAFLVFLWNAVRYFIIGSGDEASRESAKRLALWGIIAFVIMVSVWGIVNLIVGGLGFDRSGFICPDYLPAAACPQGPSQFP